MIYQKRDWTFAPLRSSVTARRADEIMLWRAWLVSGVLSADSEALDDGPRPSDSTEKK